MFFLAFFCVNLLKIERIFVYKVTIDLFIVIHSYISIFLFGILTIITYFYAKFFNHKYLVRTKDVYNFQKPCSVCAHGRGSLSESASKVLYHCLNIFSIQYCRELVFSLSLSLICRQHHTRTTIFSQTQLMFRGAYNVHFPNIHYKLIHTIYLIDNRHLSNFRLYYLLVKLAFQKISNPFPFNQFFHNFATISMKLYFIKIWPNAIVQPCYK